MLRNRLAMDVMSRDKVARRQPQRARGVRARRGDASPRARWSRPPDRGPDSSSRLDGDAPQDRTPACDRNADPLCAGDPVFNDYSVEVVQRIGYDSFTPDSGVLIAKNKDRQTNSCGYGCHAWVIDAHPEDMKRLDFVKPNGERVMRTIADYRQLNDALFHAGLRSGSQLRVEGRAEPPALLRDRSPRRRPGRAVVRRRRALARRRGRAGARRRRAGAGRRGGERQRRQLTASPSPTAARRRRPSTGHTRARRRRRSPATSTACRSSVEGAGWEADVQNALVAVKAGESARVPVFARRASGNAASARVTVTIVSESDPTKRATTVTTVRP